MNAHPAPASISWLPWSTDAFQRAHATGRPVLLSIVTRWSAACAAMETDVLADPAVAAAVSTHAVPVRVDADLRPDIAERYGLGGWPTTVWLTPDGEMLRGGTYVDADTLVGAVHDVATAFTRDRTALVQHAASARRARAARQRTPSTSAEPDTLEAIRTRILDVFDPEFGGFGRDAKFPVTSPLLFALHAGVASADAELIAVAERTLDCIADGELSDRDSGAFHRACANRDWTGADGARLLEVQADLIVAYLDAWRLRRHDRYRARAVAALEYVDRSLRERDRDRGAFYHSEVAGEESVNRHPLLVSESNARMMRALVHASQVLDDTRWILTAVDVAERLLPIVYVRASGIAHCLLPNANGPHERRYLFGLLASNILTAGALLEIGEAAGQPVYVELAEELARSSLRRFWDDAEGGAGFVDRIRTVAGAGDVGLLGEPLKPFGVNVEAARLLTRLAARTGDATLAARAREAVQYVAVTSPSQGILSSDYGLLRLELGQNAA